MHANESVGASGEPSHHRPTALNESSSRELRSAAEDVASSVEQLYRMSNAFLGKHAEERPYLILGAAAGVGFILGAAWHRGWRALS